MADSLSLSPNLISYVDTVSFSFTIGTVPSFKSSLNVFFAFVREVSSRIVAFVIRICAAVWLYSEKSFWYTIMRRAWPTAAYACFSATVSGFFPPRVWRPVAMAPEETRITSFPMPLMSLMMRTSFSIFARFRSPVSACVSEEDPILITILFLSFNNSLSVI